MTKESVIEGAGGKAFAPWDDQQRDGQIEALRYVVCRLAMVLHQQGVVDLRDFGHDIEVAALTFFQGNQEAQGALGWFAETLSYMQSKTGSPGDEGVG